MKLQCVSVASALALVVTAAACQKASPTRPSTIETSAQTSSVTDAKTGVTLTTPRLAAPAAGQKFKFADQPLTLTAKNAVTTGSSALTYTFQVASDSGFANLVYSKDGVAEGGNGETSLQIDKLAGDKDYYWRASASGGGTVGLFSAGRTFNVGPEVVIQAPVQTVPANGATANGSAPVLTVSNASYTGPAGAITYRFDVSTSSSFDSLVFSASSVAQGSGTTSTQVTANLIANATYYWRVQASDSSSGVTSPFSSVFSFIYVPFDMRDATILDSPPDLGSWAEGAKITSIQFSPDAFQVDFDRRDGPNRWPDVGFFSGSLEYTLGMCLNPGGAGHWYCSAVVQFWYGRELTASTPPSYVGRNWFYDARWGPLLGYQPSDGETVGLFVAAGNLRDATYTLATCPRVCERSNVALVPWQNNGFSSYTY